MGHTSLFFVYALWFFVETESEFLLHLQSILLFRSVFVYKDIFNFFVTIGYKNNVSSKVVGDYKDPF